MPMSALSKLIRPPKTSVFFLADASAAVARVATVYFSMYF